MRAITWSHWKIWTTYYFYSIWQIGENKYELTIELNRKVVKQKTANDDKSLRAYAMWYIDWLKEWYNKWYSEWEEDWYKNR